MAGLAPGGYMCDDRPATNAFLGIPGVAGGLACHAALHPVHGQCQLAPVTPGNPQTHAAGAHSVCLTCWGRAGLTLEPQEARELRGLFVRRGGPGEPAYVFRSQNFRTLLCTYCEADELELYRRNTVLGAAPPADAVNGWVNSCVCQQTRTMLQIRAGFPGPRYCVECRLNAMRQAHRVNLSNLRQLNRLARDRGPNATRVTATNALCNWRRLNGCPLACRCGRNTTKATPRRPVQAQPKVTMCACCSGIKINTHLPFVNGNARSNARIIAAAALPAGAPGSLRPLRHITVNQVNINARPPVSRSQAIVVGVNNNRK